jgi:hypothetical protein
MSPTATKEYSLTIAKRYKHARKKFRTLILNEYCATCNFSRKHAITKLNNINSLKSRKKPGRASQYNHEAILGPLKKIWLTANLPCSKRLVAMIPFWLEFLPELPFEVKLSLLKISASTIDRLLKHARIKYKFRGRSSTKPGTLLRKHIPIKLNQWDESRPGFLEADTVAHCGTSLSGNFIYSIVTTDIATGWTEVRATWGKGELGVLDQIKDIERSLPFNIKGFDSDNGSEFLNYHLLRHFTDTDLRSNYVEFTRSRPYHKNDNAHVEQKNCTHVRQWLGYYRFDNPDILPILNSLYKFEFSQFQNFFLPSVKLLEKRRIGSRTIKIFDKPKTPFQRILESDHIDKREKLLLKSKYQFLNPFNLRKNMEIAIKNIFALASNKLASCN